MLYQHHVELNLSIDALTIDSKTRSKKDNTFKVFGAGSIDWPELHASEQDKLIKRARSAHRQRDAIGARRARIAQSINKKSECRASILRRSIPIAQTQQEQRRVA